MNLGNIPAALTGRPQWVGFTVKGSKKTPHIADAPHKRAKSNDPQTWRQFEAAAEAFQRGVFDAIAYALNGEGIIGVDLDDCYDAGGKLTPYAANIVHRCRSYAERSFSGQGIHLLLAGTLQDGKGYNRNGVEIYDRGRFFICTGDRLTDAPTDIGENPDAVKHLLCLATRENLKGDDVIETPETIEAISPPLPALSAVSNVSIGSMTPDKVVAMTLPRHPGERNRKILALARGLKFNVGLASSQWPELKPLVRQWFQQALPFIRTKDFSETWSDFVHAWSRARFPLGMDVLSRAWEQSKQSPLPDVAADYDNEMVRRLIGLCVALARFSPRDQFFLACGQAASLLDIDGKQVARWLKMLRADNILELVEIGNAHHATRYRLGRKCIPTGTHLTEGTP